MGPIDFSAIQGDPVLMAALEELARRKWLLRAIEAQKAQDQLAKDGILEAKAVEGMGEVTRRVHAFAYHDWAHKLGSDGRPVYDCWQDRGFNRYYDRIAPETKVRSKGSRIQVGYTGPTPEPLTMVDSGTKRFSKTYTFPKPEP